MTRKQGAQVSLLGRMRKPISVTSKGEVNIVVTKDRGRIWVNDETGCVLRVCMLPAGSIVAYNKEAGTIDIIIPDRGG